MSRSAHLSRQNRLDSGRRPGSFRACGPSSSSTRARATAAPTSCSTAAGARGSTCTSSATGTTCRRSRATPTPTALAHGRRRRLARRRSPTSRSSATCRSRASRSGRATTSRATLGLDRDDPIGALDAFVDGVERRDRRRPRERPALPEQRLARCLRAARAPARAPSPPQRRVRAPAGTRDPRHAPAARRHHRRRRAARGAGRARVEQRYDARLLSIGERDRLDEGGCTSTRRAGCCARHWDERHAERFTVDAGAGRLRAAVDGEPDELETPIEFRIEPQALRVLLPRNREPSAPGGT